MRIERNVEVNPDAILEYFLIDPVVFLFPSVIFLILRKL